jgi:cell envelope opacity-associated protein A
MGTRTLSRRGLREQHDQAEKIEQMKDESEESSKTDVKVKKPRVRKATTSKQAVPKPPSKPRTRKKAKVPPRMFARWAVCDGGLKRLAVFDYKDRADADAKLVELQAQRKGPFFLQLVKVPYDPPVNEPAPAD